MNPTALLLAGVPPSGLGLYARDTVEPGPWSFVALNFTRADLSSQVRTVRGMGAQLWLYAGPDHFEPHNWRASLERAERLAAQHGAVGIIVDSEGGWESARESDAVALGEAMAALSLRYRVGFTSYPTWRFLDAVARSAGSRVFASIQIYGRSSRDPRVWQNWLDAWEARFGGRVNLSIAGWIPAEWPDSESNEAGYRRYLSRLPRASGAIAWDAAGRMPAYIRQALTEYSPGGNSAATAALAFPCGAKSAGPAGRASSNRASRSSAKREKA